MRSVKLWGDALQEGLWEGLQDWLLAWAAVVQLPALRVAGTLFSASVPLVLGLMVTPWASCTSGTSTISVTSPGSVAL